MKRLFSASLITLAATVGCESSDPGTGEGASTTTTTTIGSGGSTGGSGGGGGVPVDPCATYDQVEQVGSPGCTALAGDYEPRENNSANDSWAACISDDNTYHPFDVNISSIARVAAFEQIRTLLSFGSMTAPGAQAFTDARIAYSLDQGLESRVSRREDEHYPPAPAACNTLTADEQAKYPDRCVGPVKIQPLLNQAFQDGQTGKDPLLSAVKIEAGLLWFLFVSVYKEARTCAKTQADCDSSWAYYTGGETRDKGLGLSKYFRARSLDAHDRVWDGSLAVRCWRDLDNPTGTATDTAMEDLATSQLDRALLRGMALIVRGRLQQLPCSPAWASVQILGPVLDREATVRDPTKAAILRTEIAKTDPSKVDIEAATDALDAIFQCP